MKRFFVFLLAVLLCIVIVGCGKNPVEGTINPVEDTINLIEDTNNPAEDIINPVEDTTKPPIEQVEQLGFSGGNISAGGLLCDGGDGYIYYRSQSDGWKLYRAKPDGTDKSKISDRVGHNINVLDGWVYFLDYPEFNPIYRIRTDGTEETKLVDGYCGSLYVAESSIYFDKRDETNASHIYRADLDGSNMTLLFSEASLMYYYKGMIFLGAGQLGVYNIETGEETILDDTFVANVSVDDSGLYYWAYNEGEFRRMDLDGGNKGVILKGGDFFNYTDGYLYYMGISENENGPYHVINRLSVETGDIVTLYEALNEFFDRDGNLIGVTYKQMNEGNFNPDLFEFNSQGEMVLKGGGEPLSESVGYVYVAGEFLYMRASLRDDILQNGRFDSIVRLDNGLIIWD
ncbi:MAG: DUF5050 domain-containing protein [Defluviitaleaceae bacterium]|nr:DUF5050 domain-containing protein [Defluviitaleaceae bacterium]